MSTDKIISMDYKIMLEKYWKGETSIAEEKALRHYFSTDKVDPELMPYKELFVYYKVSKETELTASVPIFLDQPTTKDAKVVKLKRFSLWRSVAAAVLLLISFSIIYNTFNQPTKEERLAKYWAEKEIKNPVLAYQKTKAALQLVSQKLNGGTAAAIKQVSKVQKVGKTIRFDINK